MRTTIWVVVVVLFLVSSASAQEKIDLSLSRALTRAGGDELIRVVIIPTGQPDVTPLLAQTENLDKEEKRAITINTLKAAALENHAPILRIIEEEKKLGNATRTRSLWLANVVAAELKKSAIEKLAACSSVEQVYLDQPQYALISSAHSMGEMSPTASPMMPDTVWNLDLVGAPCAWDQGYTGQNIIVGHFDTGVNYNHHDLADHVWTNPGETTTNGVDDDGNGYIDDYYGFDFSGVNSDPMDDNGHGTHTAGTVAGDGTAGTNTGIAPDARIMSLKVLDYMGYGYEPDVWEAIQYAVDMGADVLTFSIGWSHMGGPDRGTWRASFDVVRTAGICAAVAAGNERQYWWTPPPDNVRTPGDVPPPWLHPDQTLTGGISGVVTVGATDTLDEIADFSSMGPVTWATIAPYNDYPYNPQMGLMDPDVSAPGTAVTSLRHNNNTGYVGGASYSGTSMACPHVAGLMALMLSRNPGLTPSEVDSIIETTALELGTPGKDNDFGSGRIRVCEVFVGIEEEPKERRAVPTLSLSASPNPFTDRTEIVIALEPDPDRHAPAQVHLYDLSGRLVRSMDIQVPEGPQVYTSLTWNGADSANEPLPGGIYFLKVKSGRDTASAKVVLLR